MLYFFRLLILLISIDQETVLNWFGLENPNNPNTYSQAIESVDNLNLSSVPIEPSSALSLNTLKLIVANMQPSPQS